MNAVAAPSRDPAWLRRVFWIGAALAVLWPMLVATEFKPWLLLTPESLKPTSHFLATFFPPAASSDFLAMVARETWRTVAIATAGIALALLLAIPLTYGGMLGKVYGEILESGETHAAQALMRNGAGRLQTFFYAVLPGNAAELVSYTVYRWECAIRSSVVLGFVGAGGLGQQLDTSAKMFAGSEVATMLLVFIALVALADRASSYLRRALG